jgi:NitT/TauT family transport system substrate-binding protein
LPSSYPRDALLSCEKPKVVRQRIEVCAVSIRDPIRAEFETGSYYAAGLLRNPPVSSTPQRYARCKHVFPGFLLAALALFGAGCGSHVASEGTRAPIRLGSYEWPGSYWIDVAWEKGWFREAGLNVQRVDTNLKYVKSLDSVAEGTIDATGFAQFDLVRYVASGHDLVGVAAFDYSEGAEALIAKAGYRHLRELRGKRIALARGTYLEFLFNVIAEREGLGVDQFQLVEGESLKAIADLKDGKVDAIFVWEPYATQAKEQTGGVALFSTADFPGLAYTVLSFRRQFVESRPDDVVALLRVWQRTVEYIRENPKEACAIVSRLVNDPLPYVQDMMTKDRILDLADNSRAFSYAAGYESLHGSWRRMNDFMIERGLVSTRVESPAHLDARFLNALD